MHIEPNNSLGFEMDAEEEKMFHYVSLFQVLSPAWSTTDSENSQNLSWRMMVRWIQAVLAY